MEGGENAGRSLRIAPLQSAKAFGNKSNIQSKRNDTRVVPYKPYLQENIISKRILSLQGRNPKGAPRIPTRHPPLN